MTPSRTAMIRIPSRCITGIRSSNIALTRFAMSAEFTSMTKHPRAEGRGRFVPDRSDQCERSAAFSELHPLVRTTKIAPGDGVHLIAINADNQGSGSHVLTSLAGRTHHPDNR